MWALPLLFATSLAAQDSSLTGKWVFTVESPNGTGTRQVTLVQEGDSLSGTIASSRASGDITGWVEGANVTIRTELMMESGPFTVFYTATRTGETLSGDVDFGDYGVGTFEGRRVEGDGGERPLPGLSARIDGGRLPVRLDEGVGLRR
jgi:hypothetical protein